MLGYNIQKIRESKKLGLNETARLAGISGSYLSNIEKGNKKNPSMNTLEKLADALGVPLDYLLKKSPAALIEENLKDMTTQDLADKTNLTVDYLNNLDNIIPDEKDYENMKRIGEVLGIDLTNALGLQEPPTYESNTNTPQNDFDAVNKQKCSYSEIDTFDTPEAAMKFILKQPSIMGFGGFDVEKMSEDEIVEFANELLNQLKLISYKYK